MTAERKLSPRHKKFVAEYLVDLCATQAAIRAGYSARTAGSSGERMLKTVEIARAVEAGKAKRLERIEVTQDQVVQELRRIAFSDPRSVMTWGPKGVRLRSSKALTNDEARLVAEVSETAQGMRLKMHDKPRALELLGRHLGIFSDGPTVVIGTTGAVTVYVPTNGRDPAG
jgi:phage terminase small subunit